VGTALLFVALARPQVQETRAREKQPGYDIMLAVDLSTSMYAEDFDKDGAIMNRRQAVKPILEAGGLKTGTDFFLAFSPEREDPGTAAHLQVGAHQRKLVARINNECFTPPESTARVREAEGRVG